MAVGGAISFAHNDLYGGSYTATDISGFIMLAGIASDIVSIPFFISAAKNKIRAASISFINKPILTPLQNSVAYKMQPALGFKIQL